MNTYLTALVAKLPLSAQPYAKALLPLLAVSLVAATDLAFSGPETRQIVAEAGVALTSLLTLLVPNRGEVA